MTDTKIHMGLITNLVKKLDKLENAKESEGSEWSKVQGKDRKAKMKVNPIHAEILENQDTLGGPPPLNTMLDVQI